MFQRSLPLPAALLAAIALCGCASIHAADVSEEVDRTVALSSGGALTLSNVNGRIDISAWDRDEVRIHAVKRASSQAKLDEIEPRSRERRSRRDLRRAAARGSASVSYEISAPAGAAVRVKTVNGRVRLAGLRGEVAANSVNGAIDAAGLVGPTKIETVNGAVEAIFAAAPAPGSHQLKTVNGSLEVRLPSEPDASFRAHTVNGGIKTDFPLQVRRARFGPMSSLEGSLGSGAAKFDLGTVNGAIRILSGSQAAAR